MFELQAVSFDIPERTLLYPLDLTLPHGQIIGLIGHNGSGKSTLIKLLARQQVASQGTVKLDGVPLPAWKNREFARQVAYLPQQLPAADGLTVRELVRFGRYPWHGALGRMSEEDHAQVEQAMALTHTGAYAERLVDNLSGGERQRDLGVVVVLHEINMAARYCDHLVALHSGRLLIQGPPAELMNSAVLESIYGIRMGVMPHPHDGSAISFHY